MTGFLKAVSAEAFRERLETAAIKRKMKDERLTKQRKPSRADKASRDAMRRIEDIKLAKRLGISVEDLQ